MVQVYSASPATTEAFTSDAVHSERVDHYTFAVWSHAGSYIDLTLQGAFTQAFDPVWTISEVTACAGGATGSGRYIDSDDYFPWKRAVGVLSASVAQASASGVKLWIENDEF
jgi:hypothetical protein